VLPRSVGRVLVRGTTALVEGATTAEPTEADESAPGSGTAPATAHDERRPVSPLHIGIMLWLASDVMFFAGLFAAWFVLRAENDVWPPEGIELDVIRSGVFTCVLILSSLTMHFCVKSAEKGDKQTSFGWLGVTLVLGAVFLINQLLEYASLDFSLNTDAYGSIYYLLTGFHGLHVFGGLCLMLALFMLLGPMTSKAPFEGSVTAFSYYWHFVDVVWVVVFLVVYVIA
jgi:cytochrome c oxidase subunit 3